MAICEYCNREMQDVVSCAYDQVVIRDVTFARLPFGQETRYDIVLEADWHCPDCAAPQGGQHHIRCDWEQCPRCGGQQLSCDCAEGGDLIYLGEDATSD